VIPLFKAAEVICHAPFFVHPVGRAYWERSPAAGDPRAPKVRSFSEFASDLRDVAALKARARQFVP
jgi:hypothetical protein